MKPYSVVFVYMGNNCRSPTADGVFRHKVQQHGLQDIVTVDSAGTHNYHPGSPPEPRSQEHAAAEEGEAHDGVLPEPGQPGGARSRLRRTVSV